MMNDSVRHFIRVFTFCQSTCLLVSRMKGVNSLHARVFFIAFLWMEYIFGLLIHCNFVTIYLIVIVFYCYLQWVGVSDKTQIMFSC